MEINKLRTFASLHPGVAMAYFISIIVISMFASNPIILLSSLFGGMVFYASVSNAKRFISDLFFYIPMSLLIAIVNPLFSHNGVTPLFFMNGNPITLEAILCGLDIAAMITAVIYWCKCYSIIMTTDKFLFLFGKAIPKLSLVLSMALRFIPLFVRKLKEIRSVQAALGFYNRKGFINKIISELKVFSALITWSLENSADASCSMKSRGYGLKGRTHFSLYRFTLRDACFLAADAVLALTVIAGMFAGIIDFTFYPALTPIVLEVKQLPVYTAFFLLSILPSAIEIKEGIVWRYSASKI